MPASSPATLSLRSLLCQEVPDTRELTGPHVARTPPWRVPEGTRSAPSPSWEDALCQRFSHFASEVLPGAGEGGGGAPALT